MIRLILFTLVILSIAGLLLGFAKKLKREFLKGWKSQNPDPLKKAKKADVIDIK